jgi:hypothetical protein
MGSATRRVEIYVGPSDGGTGRLTRRRAIGIDLGELAMSSLEPKTVKRSACEPLGIWVGEM